MKWTHNVLMRAYRRRRDGEWEQVGACIVQASVGPKRTRAKLMGSRIVAHFDTATGKAIAAPDPYRHELDMRTARPLDPPPAGAPR